MFIISRNAQGRATLQHEIAGLAGFTVCGISYQSWPRRWYSDTAIPELICKKCRPPAAPAVRKHATVTPLRRYSTPRKRA